ncbi:MAG: O-antigen ligase family protein [Actinomycetes bacterium]
MSSRPVLSRPDRYGVLLLAAFAGWVIVVGADSRHGTLRMLAAVGVLAAAYVGGRWAGRSRFAATYAALAAAAGILALLTNGLSSHPGPLAPPLGYANADAALAVQTCALTGLAAVLSRRPVLARLLLLVATCLLGYTALVRSAAGVATGALVLLIALLVASTFRRRLSAASWVATLAAITVLTAVALTATLGALHSDRAGTVFSQRRVDLWHDAVTIVRDQPVTGAGPGRFAQASPTAAADPDTRAAHSAAIEQAAETGLPGAVLLGALWLWVFWRAWRPSVDAGPALIATGAWLALGLHSSIDYVADFPAVLALAGLVMGMATSASVPVRDPRLSPAAGNQG